MEWDGTGWNGMEWDGMGLNGRLCNDMVRLRVKKTPMHEATIDGKKWKSYRRVMYFSMPAKRVAH